MDTTYIEIDRLPRFTKDSSSTSEDLEIISKTNTSLRKIGNDICPPESKITDHFPDTGNMI